MTASPARHAAAHSSRLVTMTAHFRRNAERRAVLVECQSAQAPISCMATSCIGGVGDGADMSERDALSDARRPGFGPHPSLYFARCMDAASSALPSFPEIRRLKAPRWGITDWATPWPNSHTSSPFGDNWPPKTIRQSLNYVAPQTVVAEMCIVARGQLRWWIPLHWAVSLFRRQSISA